MAEPDHPAPYLGGRFDARAATPATRHVRSTTGDVRGCPEGDFAHAPVIRNGLSSLLAAWAISAVVLTAGQHAATLAFYIAWPILFWIARLARGEQERRADVR